MSGNYILDAKGEPVEEPDVLVWAKWFDSDTRDHFASRTWVANAQVSTVFLGLDHAFGEGPPILWETMIFCGERDEYQERYTSKADAIAGHKRIVAELRSAR